MYHVSSFRIHRELAAQHIKNVGHYETYDEVNAAIVNDADVPHEAQALFKRKCFRADYMTNGVEVMVIWVDTLAYLISPQRYATVRDL